MKRLALIFALIFAQMCPSPAYSQSWSGIIPVNHGGIDWTQAGIPGGIPARATICSTLAAGASNATIQNALNACPSGQVVKLGAGTFTISSSLNIPSNVTLRGNGPQSTILNATGVNTNGSVVNIGSSNGSTPSLGTISINSGATAGSTSIVVSSTTGMAVGRYLIISELNLATLGGSNYVANQSTDDPPCTWCDNGLTANGTRVRGQLAEITSIVGTTVGISPGLYTDYTQTPIATPYTAAAKMAGVENLQIFANNTGYLTSIGIYQCAYCWVKNVEDNFADGDHVRMQFSYRSEIRDNYFSNAFSHTSGTTDADILVAGKSTANLIQNNILERLHTSIMLAWGPAGNVIAYNYSIGSYDCAQVDGSGNCTVGAPLVVTIDFDAHGAHPQFNLLEGNVTPHIFFDSFWGTGAFNTFYRNWDVATTPIAKPFIGRGTINWAGAYLATQQPRGISMSYTQTRNNIIGDVAGSAQNTSIVSTRFTGGPAECTSCIVAPGARDYEDTFYAWDIGYDNGGDTSGSGVPAGWSTYPSTFIHGVFDTAKAATIWDVNFSGSHTLPASFYLSSKPAWFGNVAFPPIGPDVVGGIDVSGHVQKIPAQACYDATAKSAAGILLYDGANCYPTSVPTSPTPSTVPIIISELPLNGVPVPKDVVYCSGTDCEARAFLLRESLPAPKDEMPVISCFGSYCDEIGIKPISLRER
jgi:hypothetical protein